MPRNLFYVMAKYAEDPVVAEFTSHLAFLQLSKLRGAPIVRYRFNPDQKGIVAVEIVGDYDEMSTETTKALYTHIKSYYPELLPPEESTK